MTGFLASGRATRFLPQGETLRAQAQMARSGNRAGVVPETERGVARHARDLLAGGAFQTVMAELVDSARATFEKSPFGSEGDNKRAIAHAQIQACNAIIEKLQAMADDAKIYDRIEAENAEHD